VQYVTDLLFEYQRTFYLSIIAVLADQWEVFPEIENNKVSDKCNSGRRNSFAYTGSRLQLLDNVIATNHGKEARSKSI
jgi:hypothetical protein